MHPGPIGRGLSLHSNLFDLDYNSRHSASRRRRLGTQGLVQIQSAQEFIWRRVEDNRVQNPIANCWLAFRGVKDTLLFLESKERKEKCLGTEGHPRSKDNASTITGASDIHPKCVAHGWLLFERIINLYQYF